MRRSHYHDQRHDWNRGLYRELIVVNFDVNRGNRVYRRTFLGGPKSSANSTIDFQSEPSHQIVLHRRKTPRSASNRGDRNRSWTRQNPLSVEMCCDLIRSAPICDALSVPFAQCLSRVTHE